MSNKILKRYATIVEAKKIACLECDEVSTEAAWKKNDGTCPKCNVSTKGVAEGLSEGRAIDGMMGQYYITDNDSQVDFGVHGKINVLLNSPKGFSPPYDGQVAKLMRTLIDKQYDLQRSGIMGDDVKGEQKAEKLEADIKKVIGKANIRIGKDVEKIEKEFKKQLLAILKSNDAQTAKELKALK